MIAKYKSLSLITGILLLGVAAWFVWNEKWTMAPGGGARPDSAEDSGELSSIRPRHGTDLNRFHAKRRTIISAEQFARLKQKLVAHNAQCTGWISPEFESFIGRLLTELQFTPEMLEILDMVEAPEFSRAKRGIYQALKLRLQQPESTAARRSFVAVAGDARWSAYAQKLCWFVGEGCSSEELESLVLFSSDSVVGRNLELGHNLRRVASDPVGAIDSTMAYYRNRETRSGTPTILSELFDRLPADTDFGALDALLPASLKKNDDAYFRHAKLLGAWGRADPAAAANYVMDDLERFSPELMTYVVDPYAREHTDDAIAWVQEFPPGPHSDVAISAVVNLIADTRFEEARELAARITDLEMRNEALQRIAGFESRSR